MIPQRRFPLATLLPGLLAISLLAACGGGAGGSGGGVQPTSLSGRVLEVDGETNGLGGVQFMLDETGEFTTSRSDGTFDFQTSSAGTNTLRLVSAPRLVAVSSSGSSGSSSDDDSFDDDSFDDDSFDDDSSDDSGSGSSSDDFFSSETEIRILAVGAGERIVVEVRIRDGRIEESRCSRSDDGEREVEVFLAQTPDNDDPDLKGKLEIESELGGDKFEVEVEHATPGRIFDLVVIAPDGAEESQGLRSATALGRAEWEFEAEDGDRLPFGVVSVAALDDHVVEVRDDLTGLALLAGGVPTLPAGVSSGSGGSGSGGSGDDDERLRGRARLTAHEPGLEGYVEVRSRPEDARERFDMEAEHLAPGRTVSFHIQDPSGGGILFLGTRTANGVGEAELELDTDDGHVLPGGVTRVTELVGLAVEVRDANTNALLLSGVVPQPRLD